MVTWPPPRGLLIIYHHAVFFLLTAAVDMISNHVLSEMPACQLTGCAPVHSCGRGPTDVQIALCVNAQM